MEQTGTLMLVLWLDSSRPCGPLDMIDLAKVEQGFLRTAPAGNTPIFHHTPMAAWLAIFESIVVSQEHPLQASYSYNARGANWSMGRLEWS